MNISAETIGFVYLFWIPLYVVVLKMVTKPTRKNLAPFFVGLLVMLMIKIAIIYLIVILVVDKIKEK
jgi:hypothetical protein